MPRKERQRISQSETSSPQVSMDMFGMRFPRRLPKEPDVDFPPSPEVRFGEILYSYGAIDTDDIRRGQEVSARTIRIETRFGPRLILMVANGMGVRGNGTIANPKAIFEFPTDFGHFSKIPDKNDAKDDAKDISEIDAIIKAISFTNGLDTAVSNDPNHKVGDAQLKPGTTWVAAVLDEYGKGYVVNMGDSRAYILNQTNIQQIPNANSASEELATAGAISPFQVGERITPVDLSSGESLILGSDGLWNDVTDERIAQIVERASSTTLAVKNLIGEANGAEGNERGRDNITAVVARMVENSPTPLAKK